MNGQPLRPDHGAPFRIIVPHWFAVASVKWLHRIDVLTEPYAGEFQTGHYIYEWPDRPHEPVTLSAYVPASPTRLPAPYCPLRHRQSAGRPGLEPARSQTCCRVTELTGSDDACGVDLVPGTRVRSRRPMVGN